MKILNYKEFERLSEDDINKLLDKGIDNLSDTEKKKLTHANDDTPIELTDEERKDFLIRKIKNTIRYEYDNFVTLDELNSELVYDDEVEGVLHMIDVLEYDNIELTIYDFNVGNIIDVYTLTYEQLDEQILEEIYNLL
jgi:hypothetical protein